MPHGSTRRIAAGSSERHLVIPARPIGAAQRSRRATGRARRAGPRRCRRRVPARDRSAGRSWRATAGRADAVAVRFPEPALAQVTACDEIDGGGERRRRNAGTQQLWRRQSPRPARGTTQPARRRSLRAAACVRRIRSRPSAPSRNDGAQASPFLVAPDGDADPVVVAGAAVGAMRNVAGGTVAPRLRRGAELRRQQRFGHRPQHRLDHREIDPRRTARRVAGATARRR